MENFILNDNKYLNETSKINNQSKKYSNAACEFNSNYNENMYPKFKDNRKVKSGFIKENENSENYFIKYENQINENQSNENQSNENQNEGEAVGDSAAKSREKCENAFQETNKKSIFCKFSEIQESNLIDLHFKNMVNAYNENYDEKNGGKIKTDADEHKFLEYSEESYLKNSNFDRKMHLQHEYKNLACHNNSECHELGEFADNIEKYRLKINGIINSPAESENQLEKGDDTEFEYQIPSVDENMNRKMNMENMENILEIELKDMIQVFMDQNKQFDFLNKFYENSEDYENNEYESTNNELYISKYNIYIWKNIIIYQSMNTATTKRNPENKIENVISVAKNKYDAINILKKRYFITKNQQKTGKKKIFSNIDCINDTESFRCFVHQLYSTKCFVFPCKDFSAFY
jgi:hypothetical protein